MSAAIHPRHGIFQLPWLPEKVLGAFQFARLKAALRRSALKGTFSSRTLGPYVEAWARPGALSCMLAYYRALRRPWERATAQPIRPSVQIIWGDKDRFLGRALMEASLARCGQGSLAVIANGTHWLHLEHPERITAEIVSFCSL
ncbi:alpha/beta hydrolase [Novosphingobium sp. G106]|nr:alpha/beta hydrolase [Novosphingobium sp. G106]